MNEHCLYLLEVSLYEKLRAAYKRSDSINTLVPMGIFYIEDPALHMPNHRQPKITLEACNSYWHLPRTLILLERLSLCSKSFSSSISYQSYYIYNSYMSLSHVITHFRMYEKEKPDKTKTQKQVTIFLTLKLI